jgi:retinol dehydrogenase 12
MHGKTVLFTGSTRGMGRIAAVELARQGAELILVGHDAQRGADTLAEVQAASGGKGEFLQTDLGSAADIVRLAERFSSKHRQLHVLVHSAAGFPRAGERTAEGVDRGYALNFLGGYLLTRLLEPALTSTPGARLVSVTSMGHRMVKQFEIEALMEPGKTLTQMQSYALSKLAVVSWTYALARRWEGRVTANVLDPHMVETQIGAQFEGPAVQRFLMFQALPGLFGTTAKKAAERYVHLCAAPELATVTGAYFMKGRQKQSSPLSRDEVLGRRILEAAEAWAERVLVPAARSTLA